MQDKAKMVVDSALENVGKIGPSVNADERRRLRAALKGLLQKLEPEKLLGKRPVGGVAIRRSIKYRGR